MPVCLRSCTAIDIIPRLPGECDDLYRSSFLVLEFELTPAPLLKEPAS